MQPSKKEILGAAAKQLSQSLPVMVDSETRLDSATPNPDGQSLSYSYTLVNWRADQISAANLVAMKQQVINQTCSKAEKTLLAKGVALEFRYRSADGAPIQEFLIGPGKCIYDPYAQAYGLAP